MEHPCFRSTPRCLPQVAFPLFPDLPSGGADPLDQDGKAVIPGSSEATENVPGGHENAGDFQIRKLKRFAVLPFRVL
ncbi:MAG: hypothetical protein PVG78_15165 [Desulfobacterales bacterium]|jgi:hypothetical protein